MRIKTRYIICKMERLNTQQRVQIHDVDILREIRSSLVANYGLHGLSKTALYLRVIRFSEKSGVFIVCCIRDVVAEIKTTLLFIKSVLQYPVSITLLHTMSSDQRAIEYMETLSS